MTDFDMINTDSETENDSDVELQEAFAAGKLQPGLNIEMEKRPTVNNIIRLEQKLNEIKQNLPWLERLDMINEMAPIAPELAVQLEIHEQKRANLFAGNAKIKAFTPEQDPVLNDFKREMMFHRQAQSAVLDGIKRLHALGISTKRPDDYFAEMAKTDEHMQKIRSNLMAKQEGQAKSERLKHIREQRKMGKLIQRQARVQKVAEKREMLDQLKKFRKGKLKNLDFLEDDNNNRGDGQMNSNTASGKRKMSSKRKAKDSRFGFGGKKRGMKRNTRESTITGDRKRKGMKGSMKSGGMKSKGKNIRVGKSKRLKTKSKGGVRK